MLFSYLPSTKTSLGLLVVIPFAPGKEYPGDGGLVDGGVGTDIYEGDGARFIMTGGKVDARTSAGSAGSNASLAIGRGESGYKTFTIRPEIIGSPIIRATKDVNENPVPVVTDWPSNDFYVHVIIEY